MEEKVSLQEVIDSPQLPSLPAVAMKVLELSREENVKLADLANVIQNDQALTVRVLRTINSSFYGLRIPCPTVTRAIGYLGLHAIRTLSLSFSVVETVDGGKDESDISFDFVNYWRRAVYGATASKAIATLTGVCDPEEAFLVSLMQDIGMIGLWRVYDEMYLQAVDISRKDHRKLMQVENDTFRFTHAQVGAMMSKKWNLPEQHTIAIEHHHDADDAPLEHRQFTRVIEAGLIVALALSTDKPKEHISTLFSKMLLWFTVSESQTKCILNKVANNAETIARLLDVQTGGKAKVSAMMSAAQELILQRQIEIAQEETDVEDNADTFLNDLLFDRVQFENALSVKFQRIKDKNGSLTVLFIGPDNLNETGNSSDTEAVDQTVMQLGRVLVKLAGKGSFVSNYVSSHYAVMLPDKDHDKTVEFIESFIEYLTSNPIKVYASDQSSNKPLTVCVGATILTPANSVRDLKWQHMLRTAMRACYHASNKGMKQVVIEEPDPTARIGSLDKAA